MPPLPPAAPASRRQVLVAGAGALTSIALGCRRDPAELPREAAALRTDVPLRIVLCGTEADRDAIARAWGAVTPQTLDTTLVKYKRNQTDGLIDQLVQHSEKSDVLIYPLLAVAELSSRELLVDFSKAEFETTEQNDGPFHVALRNGMSRFGNRYVGLPVGANQPAVLSAESIDPLESWRDYHDWVGSLGGAAAEPLADGWAGAMFLWRAASTVDRGWLFDRQKLSPQIDSEPYHQVLAQMRDTAKTYVSKRSTPQEIWSNLLSGQLRGGIGLSIEDDSEEVRLAWNDLPNESIPRVLPDPFSPLASMSQRCRQSAASKRFMRWLSGGDGSEIVHRQVLDMSATRVSNDAAETSSQAVDERSRWLRRHLATPNTLPTLQLLSAGQYYTALDRQIVGCLEGKSSPQEALAAIEKQWQDISDQVGLEKQQRVWRQAFGMMS
ncbi:MAG: hypothetical protein MI861_11425 [Pirellulales bacterium]|nr:hypothetical protein [Pirellulales bacterium]